VLELLLAETGGALGSEPSGEGLGLGRSDSVSRPALRNTPSGTFPQSHECFIIYSYRLGATDFIRLPTEEVRYHCGAFVVLRGSPGRCTESSVTPHLNGRRWSLSGSEVFVFSLEFSNKKAFH